MIIYLVGEDVLALEEGEGGVVLRKNGGSLRDSGGGGANLLLELGIADIASVGPEIS